MDINNNMFNTLENFYALSAASEEEVKNAEEALGVFFANDYKQCVLSYGAISGNAHELTGVCDISRLNVVTVTEEERTLRDDIPADWYVIEQLHIDGVVIWQSPDGSIYQAVPGCEPEKIYDDLISYVLA